MLTAKNKALLRRLASHKKPSVIIGKDGLSDTTVESMQKALTANELIKVKVLNSCASDAKEIGLSAAEKTQAELIQTIGRIFVLYRAKKDHQIIIF